MPFWKKARARIINKYNPMLINPDQLGERLPLRVGIGGRMKGNWNFLPACLTSVIEK